MPNEVELGRNSLFPSACSIDKSKPTVSPFEPKTSCEVTETHLLLKSHLQQKVESLGDFAGSHLNHYGLITGAAASLQGYPIPGKGSYA